MSGFFSNLFGSTSTSSAPSAGASQSPLPPINSGATQTEAPQIPVSPLDQFTALWEPTITQGVDGTLPDNIFAGADPAKMLEAARKVDFAKSIPPDVLAKVVAGGPEAAQALVTILNDVVQRGYAQSSFASTQIASAALKKFSEGLDNRLPSQIKKHQVSETIRASNPALVHPAAQPIMDAMQSQLTVKYPNASVAEIQDMASQYLTAFTSAANPKKAVAVPANEDWGKFFS